MDVFPFLFEALQRSSFYGLSRTQVTIVNHDTYNCCKPKLAEHFDFEKVLPMVSRWQCSSHVTQFYFVILFSRPLGQLCRVVRLLHLQNALDFHVP